MRQTCAQMAQELDIQRVAIALNLAQKDLRKDMGFVNFSLKSHFHHRIDAHYQKNGLGVRFNPEKTCFELPLKTAKFFKKWLSWKEFPIKKGGIDGYDLLAYGFEPHCNKTWRVLKACKIYSAKGLPELLNRPYVELVTTYPTFKKSPGFFGHIYLNFYVPNKSHDFKFYSLCYDLDLIRFPDVMEFIKQKRISSMVPISISQWKSMKVFIEKIQETHVKKQQQSAYKSPDHKVEKFYRKHMQKNCGN